MTEKTIKDGEKMVAILAIKPAIFINLNCWFILLFAFASRATWTHVAIFWWRPNPRFFVESYSDCTRFTADFSEF
ncbi:hypothetical protein LOS19_15300 [Enterococcus faecium]|nr:hypothetical protein [Enterococcus faecium]